MKRFILTAALAALGVAMWADNADACGRRKRGRNTCCTPAPVCCNAVVAQPCCGAPTGAPTPAPAGTTPPKAMPPVKPMKT